MGLWNNPLELIKALCELSPEINVRVALVNLVEFIEELDDEAVVDAADLLEVIVESLVWLHHHVGEETSQHDEAETSLNSEEFEEIIAAFKKQLGTEEKKEEE